MFMFRNQDLHEIEHSRDFNTLNPENGCNCVLTIFLSPFSGEFLPVSLPNWIFLGHHFQALKHKFVNL